MVSAGAKCNVCTPWRKDAGLPPAAASKSSALVSPPIWGWVSVRNRVAAYLLSERWRGSYGVDVVPALGCALWRRNEKAAGHCCAAAGIWGGWLDSNQRLQDPLGSALYLLSFKRRTDNALLFEVVLGHCTTSTKFQRQLSRPVADDISFLTLVNYFCCFSVSFLNRTLSLVMLAAKSRITVSCMVLPPLMGNR